VIEVMALAGIGLRPWSPTGAFFLPQGMLLTMPEGVDERAHEREVGRGWKARALSPVSHPSLPFPSPTNDRRRPAPLPPPRATRPAPPPIPPLIHSTHAHTTSLP
jgi:hypothetical protein